MYMIYEGFQQDAFEIFEPIIKKFNFKINYLSDYGITLVNNKCKIDCLCETSLSFWYFNTKKYKYGILLTQYFYDTDKKKYEEFNKLYFGKRTKQYFVELCGFLINNLSDELKDE